MSALHDLVTFCTDLVAGIAFLRPCGILVVLNYLRSFMVFRIEITVILMAILAMCFGTAGGRAAGVLLGSFRRFTFAAV